MTVLYPRYPAQPVAKEKNQKQKTTQMDFDTVVWIQIAFLLCESCGMFFTEYFLARK